MGRSHPALEPAVRKCSVADLLLGGWVGSKNCAKWGCVNTGQTNRLTWSTLHPWGLLYSRPGSHTSSFLTCPPEQGFAYILSLHLFKLILGHRVLGTGSSVGLGGGDTRLPANGSPSNASSKLGSQIFVFNFLAPKHELTELILSALMCLHKGGCYEKFALK